MTIAELYRKFVDEYTTATTYDITLDSYTKVDGVDAKYRYEVKMSPDAYYIKVVSDEITVEYWIVDGVMYATMGEEKYKAPAVSEGGESILGMINEMLGDILSSVDIDAYIKQIEALQLYSYRGEYYYEREMIEEECSVLGFESATERVYFNAQGKVTKKVYTDGVSNISMNVKYGQPVVIKAPADADSYVEKPNVGGDGFALSMEECIETCSDLLDTLESAEIFSYEMRVDSEDMVAYATDGRDEYVRTNSDEGMFEVWRISGRGYISKDGSDPVEITIDDSLNGSFTRAANISEELFPIIRAALGEFNVATSYVYEDYIIIGLEVEDDVSSALFVTVYDDLSYVEIMMYSTEEQITLTYRNVGDVYFDVNKSYHI